MGPGRGHRRSASYYWGSSHRERSPEEQAREEGQLREKVISILREDCRRKDEDIASLERTVQRLTEALRICGAERDEARRRLDAVTFGMGSRAAGVDALVTNGEAWRGKYEEELLRNAELVRENCRLKKELGIREGKESRFGTGGSPSTLRDFKANSSDENRRLRGGARMGHKGHGRRDVRTGAGEVRVEKCPGPPVGGCCEAPDLHAVGTRTREYDRFIPARWEHVVTEETICECRHCGRRVYAHPSDVLPRQSYSNSTLAHVACEVYLHGRTAKSVARSLGIRPGTLFGLVDTVARLLHPAFDGIMERALLQRFLHADETRWWIDGKKGYAWVFTNQNIYLVLLKDTRASRVPASLFGYKEAGTRGGESSGCSLAELKGLSFLTLLITDRYGGYLPVRVAHQFCFEHLKRDLDRLLEMSVGIEEVEAFHGQFRPLLAESMSLCASREKSDDEYRRRAQELKREIRDRAFAEAEDPELKAYQDIWRQNWDSLFHWVEDRDIRCENNAAERAIRPLVIARKTSFGSQGDRGTENRQIITTVLKTVELRGLSPEKWLMDVLGKKAADAAFDIAGAVPAANPKYEFRPVKDNTG